MEVINVDSSSDEESTSKNTVQNFMPIIVKTESLQHGTKRPSTDQASNVSKRLKLTECSLIPIKKSPNPMARVLSTNRDQYNLQFVRDDSPEVMSRQVSKKSTSKSAIRGEWMSKKWKPSDNMKTSSNSTPRSNNKKLLPKSVNVSPDIVKLVPESIEVIPKRMERKPEPVIRILGTVDLVSENIDSDSRPDSTEPRPTVVKLQEYEPINVDSDDEPKLVERKTNVQVQNRFQATQSLNVPFQKFIDACKSIEDTPEMEKIIKKKLIAYYYAVDSEYVNSTSFCKLVEEQTAAVEAGKDDHYVHIKQVVDELKARKKKNKPVHRDEVGDGKTKSDEDEAGPSDSHVRKLERAMRKLQKMINKLEVAEVDFDDDTNSHYIMLERYKARMVKVFEKLCDITNENKDAGRLIKRRISFAGTRYPEINKAVQDLVNKSRKFPDYHDVLQCVKECSEKHSLNISLDKISSEAFEKIGTQLQARRQRDFYETVSTTLGTSVDPAENDAELRAKLDLNRREGKQKLVEVINKFAEKEKELKLHPEEVKDGDPGIEGSENDSTGEDSEEEESRSQSEIETDENNDKENQCNSKKNKGEDVHTDEDINFDREINDMKDNNEESHYISKEKNNSDGETDEDILLNDEEHDRCENIDKDHLEKSDKQVMFDYMNLKLKSPVKESNLIPEKKKTHANIDDESIFDQDKIDQSENINKESQLNMENNNKTKENADEESYLDLVKSKPKETADDKGHLIQEKIKTKEKTDEGSHSVLEKVNPKVPTDEESNLELEKMKPKEPTDEESNFNQDETKTKENIFEERYFDTDEERQLKENEDYERNLNQEKIKTKETTDEGSHSDVEKMKPKVPTNEESDFNPDETKVKENTYEESYFNTDEERPSNMEKNKNIYITNEESFLNQENNQTEDINDEGSNLNLIKNITDANADKESIEINKENNTTNENSKCIVIDSEEFSIGSDIFSDW